MSNGIICSDEINSYNPTTRRLTVIEYETEAKRRSSNSIRLTSNGGITNLSSILDHFVKVLMIVIDADTNYVN